MGVYIYSCCEYSVCCAVVIFDLVTPCLFVHLRLLGTGLATRQFHHPARVPPNPPNKLYTTTQHAMPKNKGKGGKNRRRGKNENESEKRELIYKEEEDQGKNTNALLSLQ